MFFNPTFKAEKYITKGNKIKNKEIKTLDCMALLTFVINVSPVKTNDAVTKDYAQKLLDVCVFSLLINFKFNILFKKNFVTNISFSRYLYC